MMFYVDEDGEIFIGVCSVDTPEEKIVAKVTKKLGIEFVKTTSVPEALESQATLAFELDTIVVFYKDYNEDYSEISEIGIGIYIIP